ncbi:RNA polymerase sigma factor [Reticulibacter mediterranei]|uniref:RNA polymerase sigma factor n=1 Tax=Reticulibacter mediterranei TaxID=2778369 RepID=A0A8J3IL13_9CHLR|nr:RNA polymerase sigma factor [Reticulibacter mediterranei]GHO95778.1 RNA polymerase sigma factor [Reticulibacter mediterranei]
MDTSIRFYNTNSSLRSPLEEGRSGHSAIPLSADNGSEQLAGECEEEAAQISTPSIVAQPEQEQEAERVDVADFEAIFLRFQGPITNFIYHLIGNREQAYDLAQDVFVKAYKALLGGTVVQPGALSAWLYRIASNTTTDTLRRRRLISWLPLSLFNEDRGIGAGVVSEAGGASTENSNGDEGQHETRASAVSTLYERNGYDGARFESRVADREIVERVFRQLRPKYAVCLWLYENDGLSCAEIAQILSISPSAVKMRLMRAREQFIALYKQEVGEE